MFATELAEVIVQATINPDDAEGGLISGLRRQSVPDV